MLEFQIKRLPFLLKKYCYYCHSVCVALKHLKETSRRQEIRRLRQSAKYVTSEVRRGKLSLDQIY